MRSTLTACAGERCTVAYVLTGSEGRLPVVDQRTTEECNGRDFFSDALDNGIIATIAKAATTLDKEVTWLVPLLHPT